MKIVCNNQKIPINFVSIGNLLLGIILGNIDIDIKSIIFIFIIFELTQNILIRIKPIGNIWRKLDKQINKCLKNISLNLKWMPYYGESLTNSIMDISFVVIGWLISKLAKSS